MPRRGTDPLTRTRVMSWIRELLLRLEDTNGRFSLTQLNSEVGVGPTIGRAARDLGYLRRDSGSRWTRWRWLYGQTMITMEVVDDILEKARFFNSRRYTNAASERMQVLRELQDVICIEDFLE